MIRKSSLNQKTQGLIAHISKMSVPQFLKRSVTRKMKPETSTSKRPVSMYIHQSDQMTEDSTKYMHDTTILMALRDTELKLLETERHKINLESKVQSLEKEIEYLQQENHNCIVKERALKQQIQEFERRSQTKDAECQEMSLNSRIKEMELSSEIAILSQKLSTIDTEKQEKQIHKIMASQNRIMEQTLPYTMSAENIYDNEDGLFNNHIFNEVLKEHTQTLADSGVDKSDDDFHLHDPDDFASSLD